MTYQYLCTVKNDSEVYIDGKMQKKGSIFVIESSDHCLHSRGNAYNEVYKFFEKQGKKIQIRMTNSIDIKPV